jgi:hypothetical protein
VERYASTALDFPHFWQLISDVTGLKWVSMWFEKPLYIIKVVKFPEKKYDKQEPTRREGPSVLFALL